MSLDNILLMKKTEDEEKLPEDVIEAGFCESGLQSLYKEVDDIKVCELNSRCASNHAKIRHFFNSTKDYLYLTEKNERLRDEVFAEILNFLGREHCQCNYYDDVVEIAQNIKKRVTKKVTMEGKMFESFGPATFAIMSKTLKANIRPQKRGIFLNFCKQIHEHLGKNYIVTDNDLEIWKILSAKCECKFSYRAIKEYEYNDNRDSAITVYALPSNFPGD